MVITGYFCSAGNPTNENLYPCPVFTASKSERNTTFPSLHILHRNTGRHCKTCGKIITSDLRQHHPAWELAAQFSVSETSLKNYFRGVYGQNISIYLREVRMQRVAELLTTTNLSVSEIAEQVGYLNQSKFSSAFKKQFNASPLEFKRRKNLERNTSNWRVLTFFTINIFIRNSWQMKSESFLIL